MNSRTLPRSVGKIDLFEHPELLPRNVQELMEKHQHIETATPKELDEVNAEFNKLGYSFEYGLSLEPFNLRRL